MRRLKLFLSKRRLKFFIAPINNDLGTGPVSVIRRALKMGATVLKPDCQDPPELRTFIPYSVIRGNSYIKYANIHKKEPRYPVEDLSLKELDSVDKSKDKLVVC